MTDRPALAWGVKQSFRNYVEATGGTTEVGGGAARTPDGAFVFVQAHGGDLALDADGKLAGAAAFLGEVRFQAHGGMLSVFLADPAVETGAGGAVLTLADSPARDYRLAIARLDLAAATRDETGALVVPAALTPEGGQVLGDHYPPGTALDPVRLVLG